MARIVTLDIETAPKVAYVWRFFKENISPKQVKEHCRILSFAAKALNEKKVQYEESRSEDDREIVSSLIDVLDKADIVVAHNGQAFDLATIKGRAVAHGLKPPSPYKVVDTLTSARKEFNFESNTLEYLATVLNCKRRKLSHKQFPGFELWLECLKGNKAAWKELKTYNIEDVLVLEEVYLKMRPYISNHPNVGVFEEGEEVVCPKCGSDDVHFRGYAYTQVSRYHKFQCQDCGSWGRTRYDTKSKEVRKNLGTNAI